MGWTVFNGCGLFYVQRKTVSIIISFDKAIYLNTTRHPINFSVTMTRIFNYFPF